MARLLKYLKASPVRHIQNLLNLEALLREAANRADS
jgi:hypothetical protein